ncbi:MAG: 3-oxoacyl-[acyl-carrier-protein] reductase FabG [Myxococcota bacterium]|nr:3-oxoacyl-[acyl-carrier-protein] reductase FabG [Myxococcota bacterium]
MGNIQYDFSGVKVIITGGTRGIGGATTLAFLRAGAQVTAIFQGNTEAAYRTMEQAGDMAERLLLEQLDISSFERVSEFYDRYENDHGAPAVLVNNAGIRRDGLLAMMKEEDWTSVLDTNLGGVFHMSRFAVKMMIRRRSGRIINITSPSGSRGVAGQTNYSASKAGMTGFTKALAREVGARGITVNAVSPGFIDTELIADLSEPLRNEYLSRIPIKRFGTAGETAQTILFLASSEASYVNGAVLEVTGGL